jgi:hypothetical protein
LPSQREREREQKTSRQRGNGAHLGRKDDAEDLLAIGRVGKIDQQAPRHAAQDSVVEVERSVRGCED